MSTKLTIPPLLVKIQEDTSFIIKEKGTVLLKQYFVILILVIILV